MVLLLELLLQLILEVLIGPILELILGAVGGLFGRLGRRAQLGVVVLAGVTAGVTFSLFFPEPILSPIVPGASLLLSPLLLGTTMHLFGRHRELNDHEPTSLATFLGGALLGLAIAATRLIWLAA